MRDRLIELIRQAEHECSAMANCKRCEQYGLGGNCQRTKIADHLLAAGVIVPPCKVWDRAYYLTSVDTEKELGVTDIFCGTVQSLAFDGKNIWIAVKYTNGLYYHHKAQDIGRDIFLTIEEADRALAERRGE